MMVALEIVLQGGAPRSLLAQPLHLVVARVLRGEDPLRVAVEGLDVARARVGEAADGHAADTVGALGVLVLPRDVVLGARRQDVDLVPGREALGDQPAVILGAAEDLGAVALDDERKFHETPSAAKCRFSCASIREGAKSARRRR